MSLTGHLYQSANQIDPIKHLTNLMQLSSLDIQVQALLIIGLDLLIYSKNQISLRFES